jgi:basic membrane protein A and related proteins
VKHRTSLRGLALLVLAAFALFVAACGSDDSSSDSGSSSGSSSSSSSEGGEKLKVAMVTDIGGLNDRSFNASAYAGLQQAEKDLGVEIRAVTSKSNADYVPNLSTLARQGYDVVFAVGFLMAEATETVAKQFPDTKFAIIDSSQAAMKSKPANVEGLLFAENQAGYLAGTVAGLYVADKGGDQVISAVGGQKIPPVDGYIAGYEAGAKAANSDVEVLVGYSQDFVDQAKCREIALDQISQGSQVVFQVAGQCGLGALDAAGQEGAQGIGVDQDQSSVGDFILTSAMKRIDQAVVQTIEAATKGEQPVGKDTVFDLKVDGVGLGKSNAEGEKYTKQADEAKQQIVDGEVTDIPTEVAAGN